MYRKIEVGTSDDPWIENLTQGEELLFRKLIDDTRTTQAGVTEASLQTLARIGKFASNEAVRAALKTLTAPDGMRPPRLEWWPNLNRVWIRNFFDYQSTITKRSNFAIPARRSLIDEPDEVRRVVIEQYPELTDSGAGDPPAPRPSAKKKSAPRDTGHAVLAGNTPGGKVRGREVEAPVVGADTPEATGEGDAGVGTAPTIPTAERDADSPTGDLDALAAQIGADVPEPKKVERPNDLMQALYDKLCGFDQGWTKLGWSGIQKAINDYSREVVTSALQDAWQNRVVPQGGAYPLLRAVCERVRREREEA